MSERIYGVFKALVTDTEIFKETGKIKIRVSMVNTSFLGKDLRDGYHENDYKDKLRKDLLASVLMPFGGGQNYGMFKLPPINSLGLMTFIDGNINLPIWIGGIPTVLHTKTGSLYSATPPSDDLFSEKGIISFNEEEDSSEINSEDLNSFVIKTKNNSFENFENPEEMNWENRRVENGIVLNKNRMDFAHFEEDGGYQRILLSEEEEGDEKYSIRITDFASEEDSSTFLLGDTGAKIEIKKGDILSEASLKEGVLELTVKKGNSQTTIRQTDGGITLENDGSLVILEKKEGKDRLILKSDSISIDSKNIILGNGGYKLVVAPSKFNLTLEDGTMLTTANNVSI